MIEIGGLFRAGLPPAVAAITALLMIVTTVLAAEEIPATTPEEVGMSPWFVAAGKGTKGEVPEHRLVPAQRAITIHDLLTHTSGLDSSGLGSAVAAWPRPGPEATLASHVPRYAGMLLDFQPGTR